MLTIGHTSAFALCLGLGLSTLFVMNTVIGPQVFPNDAQESTAPLRLALAKSADEPPTGGSADSRFVGADAETDIDVGTETDIDVETDSVAAPENDAATDAGAAADNDTDFVLPRDATVYFDRERARLTSRTIAQLDDVAMSLRDNGELELEIRGHADQRGRTEYNDRLSERRAHEVADYLIEQGVEADRLAPVGLGFREPAVTGSGETAWRKNRRVELRWRKR